MRSAPASTAALNTLREPSTFSSRVRSLAVSSAKARCTTTSAPFTASLTLALSFTSPCRYSVFFQPSPLGSNGRRAIPTIFFTRRERSSLSTIDMPRSPVGPVTATVSPSAAMAVLYRFDSGRGRRVGDAVLATAQQVAAVGDHRVVAGAAPDHVAPPVLRVDEVGASARPDHVPAAPRGQTVGPARRGDAVVARAAVDRESAVTVADEPVVAGAAVQRRASGVGEHPVVAGAAVGVVVADSGVDHVVAGAAEDPV